MVYKIRLIILILLPLLFAIESQCVNNEPRGEAKSSSANLLLIPFSFENKKILDIINELQKLKNITIILPQGPDAIKADQTATFTPAGGKQITIQAAFEMLIAFLDMAGYAMLENNKFFQIVKKGPQLNSQIMPLYIVPIEQIPFSQQNIRFLYSFTNLKLSNEQTKTAIESILKEILTTYGTFIFEPKTNVAIITGQADLIASAMQIIGQIDHSGFKEAIEVVQLFNTRAQDAKAIFDQLKLAASDSTQQPSLRDDPKANISSYFADGTIIQADSRSNSLIIMGRTTTINRIKDFIAEHIDVDQKEGKSILHVIELNYLNAQEFAKILEQVVSRKTNASQSTQSSNIRTFNPVIIRAEPEVVINETVRDIQAGRVVSNEITLAESLYSGGNRLIVAAAEEDWLPIKDLIEKMDKPQPQVIIEIFIADIRANKDKILAGTNRNLLDCGVDNGVDFLASHISAPSTVLPNNTTTLASDLLQLDFNVEEPNVPQITPSGSLLVSFNESCVGIWGLLQLLDAIMDVNVLSHPHLVVLNNGTGKMKVSVIRRALGATFINNNTPVTPFEDIRADISVEVTPQINSLNQILLEIAVNISEFLSPLNLRDNTNERSDNQVSRIIRTSAKMNNGQMLILGGLARDSQTKDITKTPILADIPVIGWFFKRERRIITHLNLAVFVITTVVEPRLRNGQTKYTFEKIEQAKDDALDTNVFDSYKDPITRFFFSNQFRDTGIEIEEYVSRTSNIEHAQKQSERIKRLLAYEENPLLNHPILRRTKA